MQPGQYDIRCRRGDRLMRTFEYTDTATGDPIPLTGYVVRAQVRKVPNDKAPALDTDNGAKGGLTVDGPAGTITMDVSGTDMDDVLVARGVWDLELVPDGDEARKFTLLAGRWLMDLDVTR